LLAASNGGKPRRSRSHHCSSAFEKGEQSRALSGTPDAFTHPRDYVLNALLRVTVRNSGAVRDELS
jgi:hypothetical protein